MRHSVLSVMFRLTTLCGVALLTTACSSTPDRYAFWRDDAPTSAGVTTNGKPNLADIPAAPDVNQARADMQELQKKLAADRDQAYRQAQIDSGKLNANVNAMTTTPVTPLASISDNPVSDENLPPVGTKPPTITDMTDNQAKPQQLAAIQPAGSALPNTLAAPPKAVPVVEHAVQPSMINPNRPAVDAAAGDDLVIPPPAPTYPVFTPPSVQINAPARPYGAPATPQDYVYGRSGVQFRQRMDAMNSGAPTLTPPPSAAPSLPINNNNITVDMSALGGPSMGAPSRPGLGGPFLMDKRGPAPMGALPDGMPAVFFSHGSTRLNKQDHKTLSQLAATAKQNGAPVRVVGHASSRAVAKSPAQAKAANLKISADRTAKVIQELARKGVKVDRIESAAVGDSNAERAPSEAAARRVDILVGQ